MIRDFSTNRSRGRLSLWSYFSGVGFMIDFKPPYAYRQIKLSIRIEFFYIQFWWDFYKE